MSRCRTGITPDAWRLEDPAPALAHGYLASASRRGYAVTGGELVQGGPGIVDRDRAATRRHMAKVRGKT